MAGILRRAVNKSPLLKRTLGPFWRRARTLGWTARSTVWRDHSLTVRFDDKVIKLIPTGQIAELLWHSDFEASERAFVSWYLRPGMRVANIGANVGLYTLMASAAVGPDGQVFALEASTSTFNLLSDNIKLNGASNIVAVHRAASDQPGRLLLRSDRVSQNLDGHRFIDFSADRSSDVSTGDEWVDSITVDAFLLGQSNDGVIAPIDLVILDVEGAELIVCRGAEQMIANSPGLAIMMECSDHREEMGEWLTNHGMEFFRWDPSARQLSPCTFAEQASVGSVIVKRRPQ